MKRRRLAFFIVVLSSLSCTAETSRVDFDSAFALYQRGHYSESRKLFLTLAQQCPADTQIDFYLARLALWFDDEVTALAHLDKALQAFPRDARLHNARGDAYGLAAQRAPLFLKLKWATKCRTAYERAVELDPENTAYRMSLLGYCLVAPRIAGGGEPRARVHAAAIGQVDPAAGRIAWATVHLAEKNPALAFAAFAEVLEQTPHDFQTLYQIGRCAALSGEQLERGEAALRHCLKLTPPVGDGLPDHAHVHFRLGNILEKRGKLAAAREEYDIAETLNPDIRPDKMALKL